MQNFDFETNLRHSLTSICASVLHKPENKFIFEFALLGDEIVFAKKGDSFLICKANYLQIENSLPETQTAKTMLEVLQMLDLPKRLHLDLGHTEFDAWLLATRGSWLCFEQESGRFWINEHSICLFSWRAVDN